jgi:mono/diheme cytochrome c family protein
MKDILLPYRFLIAASLLVATLLIVPGCDVPVTSFPNNDVYALTLARSRDVPTQAASHDVSAVIEELFGTPNEPRWPAELMDADLRIAQQNLTRAAGPQLSEKDGTHLGLFREHCVTCHALSGSGAGPASVFQNPYPRDFRPGVYKWKSTQRDAKPTRNDLTELLQHGVVGSGMPSFNLIDPEDLDALVDYIIYLSVRGQTERELLAAAVDDLGYGEDSIDDDARLVTQGESDGALVVREVLAEVSSEWAKAESKVVSVPARQGFAGESPANESPTHESPANESLTASVNRGHELFHGPIANCVGCHGKDGAGEVVTLDYDDWTKEYSTRLGLTPTDRNQMRPFKKAGALTPRLAKPRKLASGVYRGGGDTDSLYRRITQGIAGSPMPAVAVVEKEDGTGLTADQIFDLIRYVQSLAPQPESNEKE